MQHCLPKQNTSSSHLSKFGTPGKDQILQRKENKLAQHHQLDLDNKTVKERKSTKNPESRRQRGGQPKKHLSTVDMVDGAQEAVDHCPLEV